MPFLDVANFLKMKAVASFESWCMSTKLQGIALQQTAALIGITLSYIHTDLLFVSIEVSEQVTRNALCLYWTLPKVEGQSVSKSVSQ
jgi:hypothetical protein